MWFLAMYFDHISAQVANMDTPTQATFEWAELFLGRVFRVPTSMLFSLDCNIPYIHSRKHFMAICLLTFFNEASVHVFLLASEHS